MLILLGGRKMKRHCRFLVFLFFFMSSSFAIPQSNFDLDQYHQYLMDNEDLSSEELLSRFAPRNIYYTENLVDTVLDHFSYMDSIRIKYTLTHDELELLKKHHFLVTERLNYFSFGQAFHDIYGKDLPVFISTDVILQALHSSYDKILMDIEIEKLKPKLSQFLDLLYNTFQQLLNEYQSIQEMNLPLQDVDLYITIAKSLLAGEKTNPHFARVTFVDSIWNAIQAEQYVEMPLFSKRNRRLDFSQFKPRGHYTHKFWDGEKWVRSLIPYFKAMMWLGRIDFLLTQPPENPYEEPWSKEELLRMDLGAVLLNELLDMSGARSILNEIDEILSLMVGESDNLTPNELAEIVSKLGIEKAGCLLNDDTYNAFQEALKKSSQSGQKILSSIFIMDPFSTEPGILPVSFRLMGQRFIVDSYIFSNLVYDKIIYHNQKIWRPMPDPLDAMFVLGNDDAAQLLEEELNTYHYSTQLAALCYLVDAYDPNFWQVSLYNCWLQAIRLLNPAEESGNFPFFMKTAAWHQEKLNSQLASWAQLRHDNLLYAKQSYTGASMCSFPHSFVEPNPGFYRQIGVFAEKAGTYLSYPFYFDRLKSIMDTLTTLAQKELDRELFNVEEENFLKRMLFVTGESGGPPFSGWYAELFYNPYDAGPSDYTVADVHTQPTDQDGNMVGRVLHVGVGKVNLGVFLANAPSADFQPMAFVGPVMSYYEKITDNFERLTDEEWSELVEEDKLPTRPDWVNVYLADKNGNGMEKGRQLQGEVYTNVAGPINNYPSRFFLFQNYPNPFNPRTTIRFDLPKQSHVTLTVYNILGQRIRTLFDGVKPAGIYFVWWNGRDDSGRSVSSGIYLCKIRTGGFIQTKKMFLLR